MPAGLGGTTGGDAVSRSSAFLLPVSGPGWGSGLRGANWMEREALCVSDAESRCERVESELADEL